MAPKKLDWEKINPTKDFRFAPPKAGSIQGAFSVNIDVFDEESGTNERFVHQAPPLALPFGISSKQIEGKQKYTASFSFPTVRMDPQSGEFRGEDLTLRYLKFLQNVETVNKRKAFEQCSTWFKKDIKEDVLNEFYFSAVYSSDKVRSGEFSPLFTAKVNEESSRWATRFFKCVEDTNSEKPKKVMDCSMDEVPKSRKVIPLLETTGLWFAGKQFGMSFKVLQMVYFEDNNFAGFSIDLGAAAEYQQVDRAIADRPETSVDIPSEDEYEPAMKKRKADFTPSAPKNVGNGFNFAG